MKILLKKEICGSREQYMEMEPTGTQLMLFKKKKKKNAGHGTQMCDSNGYLVNFIKTRFVQVFFFFFFF